MRARYSLGGPDLDPDEVTTRTGINPDEIWRAGDVGKTGRPLMPMWAVEVAGDRSEWDISAKLNTLLDRLEPGWEALVEIGRGRAGRTHWTGHWDSDDGPIVSVGVVVVDDAQTGWVLERLVLNRIVELGALLDIVVDDFVKVADE